MTRIIFDEKYYFDVMDIVLSLGHLEDGFVSDDVLELGDEEEDKEYIKEVLEELKKKHIPFSFF